MPSAPTPRPRPWSETGWIRTSSPGWRRGSRRSSCSPASPVPTRPSATPTAPHASSTRSPTWSASSASALLLVLLHRVGRARAGVVGVETDLLLGPPLPQQVPAAVELDLHLAQPVPVLLERVRIGAVLLLALP